MTAGYVQQRYQPSSAAALLVPTGAVISYAGATAPGGWLFCDGASVSRSDYPALFDAIGTTFGAVDGNSFNLPDLQSRLPMGAGTGAGLTTRTLGTKTGAEAITDVPAHTHSGTAVTAGNHSHTQTTVNDDFNNTGSYPNYTYPSYPNYDSAGSKTWTNTINAAGDHSHTLSIDSTGNASVAVINPVLVLNYIIKV